MKFIDSVTTATKKFGDSSAVSGTISNLTTTLRFCNHYNRVGVKSSEECNSLCVPAFDHRV
jgi:hypothetical protein